MLRSIRSRCGSSIRQPSSGCGTYVSFASPSSSIPARRALSLLDERGVLAGIPRLACSTIRIAALLHDIGHYPFSHALEEIGALHHEEVARPLITDGAIARILQEEMGDEAPNEIMSLIGGQSWSPLKRLISGSLDLDKLD